MNLDKRIESIDDIFTPFNNPEHTKCYIGDDGYFAQSFEDFHDLGICRHGTLEFVAEIKDSPYIYRIKESGATYKYFLSSTCVQDEESKFRPFNLHEFLVKFPIGTTITFRRKDVEGSFTLIFVGYSEKDTLDICLGCIWYSLKELAKEYEYRSSSGEWVAFGVKEL